MCFFAHAGCVSSHKRITNLVFLQIMRVVVDMLCRCIQKLRRWTDVDMYLSYNVRCTWTVLLCLWGWQSLMTGISFWTTWKVLLLTNMRSELIEIFSTVKLYFTKIFVEHKRMKTVWLGLYYALAHGNNNDINRAFH